MERILGLDPENLSRVTSTWAEVPYTYQSKGAESVSNLRRSLFLQGVGEWRKNIFFANKPTPNDLQEYVKYDKSLNKDRIDCHLF